MPTGLVLAAGAGRRYGRPKALVTGAHEESWVARTVRVLRESGCDPVLVTVGAVALDTDRLGSVGAMGSRRTHHDRLTRLREAGIGDEALGRLRSPIGLDLGGRTPEETALSILAELVADRWQGSGSRLSILATDIHRPQGATPAEVPGWDVAVRA